MADGPEPFDQGLGIDALDRLLAGRVDRDHVRVVDGLEDRGLVLEAAPTMTARVDGSPRIDRDRVYKGQAEFGGDAKWGIRQNLTLNATINPDFSQVEADAGLQQLMPEGLLTLTVDPSQGQRYQGIVTLAGATLAECLSDYFASSEQLPTRFWLNADGRHARGLLLQQLPAERIKDAEAREESWQHLTVLAQTLTAEEQLALDNPTLLHRLYHEETVRLFEPRTLQFRCSCSRERSARALVSLGEADAQGLLEERGGEIVIDCQFCNTRYAFDAADVAQLFHGGGSRSPSDTRH